MKAKSCQNCIFALKASGGTSTTLVCINKFESPGQLHLIEQKAPCRNFQPNRKITPSGNLTLLKDKNVKLIPLTQGKFAIVHAEYYDLLSRYKWYAHQDGKKFYAYRTIPYTKKRIAMHRQIMNAPKHLLVDHIDGNSLNNRKSNLRLCTKAQNGYNRAPSRKCFSGYKGVYWNKHHNKWHVRATKSGRTFYLGSFNDPVAAAIAYDRKAKELFGEFAYLNFKTTDDSD